MKPVYKNSLAVIAGLIGGSAANMGLIMLGGELIPPPEGVDVTSMETLAKSMHLFELKHFIFPFLAHAVGTLVGAAIAAKIAGSLKLAMALTVGVFFLAGGTANVFMLPSPMWFNALDLIAAYLPMAYLGFRLTGGDAKKSEA